MNTTNDPNRHSVIADTEVRYLRSSITDQEYKLFIAHPEHAEAGRQYPVVYVLDANATFGTAVEALRGLVHSGQLPACYVVGLGYPGGGFEDVMASRYRDLTPAKSAAMEDSFHLFWDLPGGLVTGGGPDYLRFIREELKPYIANEFAADPNDSTVAGVSFAGLFALYALLTEPDTFQRYIASCPMLFFGEKLLFDYEISRSETLSNLKARVHITGAEYETFAEIQRTSEDVAKVLGMWGADAGLSELVEPFVSQLASRNYPSLKLTSKIYPEEYHNSVFSIAFNEGLRQVFDDFELVGMGANKS